jgi:hypothetical protein
MQLFKRILTSAALTAALTLPFAAFAQTPAPATTKAPKAKATKAPPPTDAEIADAKAKGLVWVNTNSETKAYHLADDKYYGKTKAGKFMTAADAEKAGYHAAKQSPIGKKKTPAPAAATPAPATKK